jgi:hypothetical protein
MWFQAVTAGTQFHGNVFMNGPRAAYNDNDGFGGGDELSHNLLINPCRESGNAKRRCRQSRPRARRCVECARRVLS